MTTIGKFIKTADGFEGKIQTLTLDLSVSFYSSRKEHEKSPDYRIRGPFGDFGAAWQRTSAAERDYLSCKIDDPSLPAPVYASLVSSDDGESFVMIWTR